MKTSDISTMLSEKVAVFQTKKLLNLLNYSTVYCNLNLLMTAYGRYIIENYASVTVEHVNIGDSVQENHLDFCSERFLSFMMFTEVFQRNN